MREKVPFSKTPLTETQEVEGTVPKNSHFDGHMWIGIVFSGELFWTRKGATKDEGFLDKVSRSFSHRA